MSDPLVFSPSLEEMLTEQIVQRGITNPRLLAALRKAPRHLFVPASEQSHSYTDYPLPIGFGQTISQPYIVALMTDLLNLQGDEIVLEVGTGSGYQAAVLGCLAKEVHTVEIIPELAEGAARTLAALGLDNVHVHSGDGSLGWPADAPYDAIIVTAAAPQLPDPLVEQLAPGGHIVLPVGDRSYQVLECVTHTQDGCQTSRVLSVAFVPLRGALGWKDSV